MFNPDQVRRWRASVESNPDLRRSFEGYHLSEAELDLPATPAQQAGPRQRIGRLYPPLSMFGSPYDPACLDGVGAHPVHAGPIVRGTYPDARVVGSSALLTEDGRLLAPGDVRLMGRQHFINRNRTGHQGFLVDDTGDAVVLRFACRPKPRHIPMDALFLHNLESGNFGSFMFRQLPQMLDARASGGKFDCYITPDRVPWFLEALNLLGFPRKPVFTVREISGEIFRSITMADGYDLEGFLRPETRAAVAALAREFTPWRGGSRRRIYVSRALSGLARPWYRVMLNELDVERRMQERGFEIVNPETLSLKAQARIFSSATHIVGPSGSGMFNVMFAQQNVRLVDIETFMITVRQHAKLYASLEAKYAFLFSPMDETDMRAPEHRRWELPVQLLDQALDWALEG